MSEGKLLSLDLCSAEEIVKWRVVARRMPFYRWKPRHDITPYELALCLPLFYFGFNQDLFRSLPPEAKRHFEEVKD